MTKKNGSKALDYLDRVNRAIDFILQNLDQPLKLEVVARVASFSPFHFHRIFQSLVGESLNEFIKRLRLERAVSLISQESWRAGKRRTLTDIALACGFDSSSDFSRCFKRQFEVAPSRFDVHAFRKKRRSDWQVAIADPRQRHLLDRLEPGKNPDRFAVSLRRLPARSVAYVRVADCFREGATIAAVARLMSWAEKRGLADGQWLGYMWDIPEVTPHHLCRYDVGLVVPAQTLRSVEVTRIEFPAMQVAEIEIRGGIDLELRALDWLYGTWLPSSGFAPTDQPGFEAWKGRPFAHGDEYFELFIQLPVSRLR